MQLALFLKILTVIFNPKSLKNGPDTVNIAVTTKFKMFYINNLKFQQNIYTLPKLKIQNHKFSHCW